MPRAHDTQQRKLADILSAHLELITQGRSRESALAQLIGGARSLAESTSHLGLIRSVDPESGEPRWDVHEDGSSVVWHRKRPQDNGVIAKAIAEHRVAIGDDVRSLSDTRQRQAQPGVLSEMAVPLMWNDRCYGALHLQSREKNHFQQSMLQMQDWLGPIARQAALTINYFQMQSHPRREQVPESFEARWEQLHASLQRIAEVAVNRLGGAQPTVEVLVKARQTDALVTLAVASHTGGWTLPGWYARGMSHSWQAYDTDGAVRGPNNGATDPQTHMPTYFAMLSLPLHDAAGQVIGVLNTETHKYNWRHGADEYLETCRAKVERVLRSTDDGTLAYATSFPVLMGRIRHQIGNIVDPRALKPFYTLLLRRIAQTIGVPDVQVAIAFYDDKHLIITPERTYNYRPETVKEWSWPIRHGYTGRAFRNSTAEGVARPEYIRDVESEPAVYIEQDPTIRTEIVAVLMREEKPFGVIDVSSPQPGSLTRQHFDWLQSLADALAPALDRADQIWRMKGSRRQLSFVRASTKGIEGMLSLDDPLAMRNKRDEVLRELVRAAMKVTSSTYGSIIGAVELPEGPSRGEAGTAVELVRVLTEPLTGDDARWQHWSATRGVTGEAFTRGRYAKYEDIEKAKSFIPLWPGTKSELAVPILSGKGRVVGVLNLESCERRMYSPEQIEEVKVYAARAANVISAFEAQVAHRHLRRLSELQRIIMSTNPADHEDPDTPISPSIQDEILQAALDLTDEPDGYASLWAMRQSHLYLLARKPRDTPVPNYARPGLVQLALDSQQPVLALDTNEPRWEGKVRKYWPHTQSELAVPLLVLDPNRPRGGREHVLGVINVESRNKVNFTQHDVDLLKLLAQVTVTAILNRQMYVERNGLIRDVLHAARKPSMWLEGLAFRLAQDPDLSAPYREQVQQLRALAKLADQSLDWYARLEDVESGKSQFEPESVSLRKLVEETINEVMPYIRAVDAYNAVDTCTSIDVSVRCDQLLVKGALFLLLDNAFDHGAKEGYVRVHLLQPRPGWARIEVQNRGAPIARPPEELFSAGIGLRHVDRIVHRHHGTRGYTPQEGYNTFWIELPVSGPGAP